MLRILELKYLLDVCNRSSLVNCEYVTCFKESLGTLYFINAPFLKEWYLKRQRKILFLAIVHGTCITYFNTQGIFGMITYMYGHFPCTELSSFSDASRDVS